ARFLRSTVSPRVSDPLENLLRRGTADLEDERIVRELPGRFPQHSAGIVGVGYDLAVCRASRGADQFSDDSTFQLQDQAVSHIEIPRGFCPALQPAPQICIFMRNRRSSDGPVRSNVAESDRSAMHNLLSNWWRLRPRALQ